VVVRVTARSGVGASADLRPQPTAEGRGPRAAIVAYHAEASRWQDTDWQQIVELYDMLLRYAPSPDCTEQSCFATTPARSRARRD
jgi:predicted RNA polymerase sigma factor